MAITELWTEKYRPDTVDNYVFCDNKQKEQVATWISEKSVPHLLFSGAPGTGKCLIGSEEITIRIENNYLSDKQKTKLSKYLSNIREYTLPIYTLFDVLGYANIEKEVPQYLTDIKISIKTLTGFAPINALVTKSAECEKYTINDGSTISCSTKHLVFQHGVVNHISNCLEIDTITGTRRIVNVQSLGMLDVYDVAIDAPHQYVTPNGIIHHNTTLAKILIKALGIHHYDLLEINASRNNSIDDVRDKITNFVSTMPFGDQKIVLLDECLDENTLVTVLRCRTIQNIIIKDLLDETDLVKSYDVNTNSIVWRPFTLYDKGIQDVLEIEFDNGEKVVCTQKHKWYVDDAGIVKVINASELSDHILTIVHNANDTQNYVYESDMQQLKIKSIKRLKDTSRVYDLSVTDTHNFFITNDEILTHNCDYLTINAQAAMRGLMEAHSASARFIMTANYPHKVIPAIHSRCQGFHIDTIDHTDFTARVATVLISENIEFELDTLDNFVKATYPDLRKCLNLLQMNSTGGKLATPSSNDKGTTDYKLGMVELLKKGKIREARELVCTQARPDEMDEFFKWAYSNLDLWSDTPEGQDEAILIIRNALVHHSVVADAEINISAMMIELSKIPV